MLRKTLVGLLSIIMCFAILPTAIGENTVIRTYFCFGESWRCYKPFISEHPDVTIQREPVEGWIDTTSQLIGKLITKQFNNDLMSFNTGLVDPSIMMEKGYYLDLSQSETIKKAVEAMYPAFQQAAMYDGKLYALPYNVRFNYTMLDPKSWKEAGYTDDDIPQSYEEFLQFLEGVCERLENDPDLPLHLYMLINFMGDYDASDYTLLLTELFLGDYITQQQMTGETLSFHDKELEALLEKTKTVCSRLFAAERYLSPDEENEGLSLIGGGNQMFWPEDGKYVISFRMNDSLPRIINVQLEMISAFAGTKNPDLCIEILESMVNHGADATNTDYSNAFLYPNAEPIVSSVAEINRGPYENSVSYFTNELARDDLEPLERRDLEEKLKEAEASLKEYDEVGKYSITQGMIDSYKQSVDLIYVVTPTPFAAGTTNGTQYQTLMKRFAQGQITTKQFLDKLNELTYMVQAEDGIY